MKSNREKTAGRGFTVRAAAVCAAIVCTALFTGAAANALPGGVSYTSGSDASGSDASGSDASGAQTSGADAALGASDNQATQTAHPGIDVRVPILALSQAVALARQAAVGSSAEMNVPEGSARRFRDVPCDGSRFAVTRADDGALLFGFGSLARFAGATEITATDGEIHARGGGFDVTIRDNAEYIISSGRAFWSGRLPLTANGDTFVPAQALAAAFGFTLRDDGEGAYLSGGGAIEDASSHYDAGELYWLSHIIYAESGCEPMLGKIAVGNVVLNRVRSESYPDTIYGVIFDCRFGTVQFSPTASGTVYLEPSEDAVIAAKICLEGFSLSDEIEFFFNPAISDSTWISDNRPWIMTIANHEFYG